MKYTYRFERTTAGEHDDQIAERLTELGHQGWRVANAAVTPAHSWVFVLERVHDEAAAG
jgi:hypothetical protein